MLQFENWTLLKTVTPKILAMTQSKNLQWGTWPILLQKWGWFTTHIHHCPSPPSLPVSISASPAQYLFELLELFSYKYVIWDYELRKHKHACLHHFDLARIKRIDWKVDNAICRINHYPVDSEGEWFIRWKALFSLWTTIPAWKQVWFVQLFLVWNCHSCSKVSMQAKFCHHCVNIDNSY